MLEGKFENGGKKKEKKERKKLHPITPVHHCRHCKLKGFPQHGLPSSKTGKDIENLSKVSWGNFVVAKV